MYRASAWVVGLAVILSTSVRAAPPPDEPCDCAELLSAVVDEVESNYPGFPTKVGVDTGDDYRALLERLRAEAMASAEPAACDSVLDVYVSFFDDDHLAVSWAGARRAAASLDRDSLRATWADWPTGVATDSAARAVIAGLGTDADPAVGIWERIRGNFRMAVLPSDTGERLRVTVLRADSVWWVPGQVRGELRPKGEERYEVTTFTRERDEVTRTARYQDGLLAFDDETLWLKAHPERPGAVTIREFVASVNARLGVRRLGPETMLIQVPSFAPRHGPVLDSLVRAHWDDLTTSPNLIIDVRGNGGGADRTFEPLLPLLYSGPVVQEGAEFYATEANVRRWRAGLLEADLSEDAKAEVEAVLERARREPGSWVPFGADTLRLERVLPRPARVAVLMDEGCGSSCEQFVLAARQSSKVTLYGDSTGGFLDYSNVVPIELPCPDFILHSPTTRSARLPEAPVDPHGIAPDVPRPDDVLMPLAWVRERLEAGADTTTASDRRRSRSGEDRRGDGRARGGPRVLHPAGVGSPREAGGGRVRRARVARLGRGSLRRSARAADAPSSLSALTGADAERPSAVADSGNASGRPDGTLEMRCGEPASEAFPGARARQLARCPRI